MHVSEGQLYAATVADFSGGEPLIHREKIRTERSDLNQLNGKHFGMRCVRDVAFRSFVRGENGLAEVSKRLVRHGPENNFLFVC